MSGSGTRRTEDIHTLRTRQLILQNQDGSYPISGDLLFFNSSTGNVGESGVNIDTGGNVSIVTNVSINGTSDFSGSIQVYGLSSLNNVNISDTLSVFGHTYLKNTDISGYLHVNGDTNLTRFGL